MRPSEQGDGITLASVEDLFFQLALTNSRAAARCLFAL
jgi:hypothetical protein